MRILGWLSIVALSLLAGFALGKSELIDIDNKRDVIITLVEENPQDLRTADGEKKFDYLNQVLVTLVNRTHNASDGWVKRHSITANKGEAYFSRVPFGYYDIMVRCHENSKPIVGVLEVKEFMQDIEVAITKETNACAYKVEIFFSRQ